MKQFILGYIVIGMDWPLVMGEDGILWHANKKVTVFNERKSAMSAISRTRAYARKNKFKWANDPFHIRALVSE